jgi:hypothetical protein
MKAKGLLFMMLMIPALTGYTQDDPASKWKKGGVGSITFSQVSLTNWAAGGENSVSGNLLVSMFANYKHEKFTWDNTLDFGYGLIKQNDRSPRKSDDRLEFSSKYGHHAVKHWYYSGMLNFKTQVSTGYKYSDDPAIEDLKISDLMSPAYLTIALGMDYKPGDQFTLLISPATGKSTFVMDDSLSNAGAFGVEAGKNVRHEFGGFLKAAWKTPVIENVTLQTKLDLFSNYFNNPQNIDVNWEVLLAMKINKYLTANLTTQMIYDDDVMILDKDGKTGPRLQFKEVFGVGLSYKF